MASITASSSASMVACACLVPFGPARVSSSSPVLGLPTMPIKAKVSCSMEKNPSTQQNTPTTTTGIAATLVTTASTALMSAPAAMALVDDRMSTEGMGLPLGLSNNLLGWILLGVFGLIWALYTIYTSDLEEDEESGLSL